MELRGNNLITGTGVLQLRVFEFHLVAFSFKPGFQKWKVCRPRKEEKGPRNSGKQISKVKKSLPTPSTLGEEKNL